MFVKWIIKFLFCFNDDFFFVRSPATVGMLIYQNIISLTQNWMGYIENYVYCVHACVRVCVCVWVYKRKCVKKSRYCILLCHAVSNGKSQWFQSFWPRFIDHIHLQTTAKKKGYSSWTSTNVLRVSIYFNNDFHANLLKYNCSERNEKEKKIWKKHLCRTVSIIEYIWSINSNNLRQSRWKWF